MIVLPNLESKRVKMTSDLQPYHLNQRYEPMADSHEIYGLGNSLIKSNFSNVNNPIVLWVKDGKYQIVAGKNRYQALLNINATWMYVKIIPQNTEESDVKELIMQEFNRRDKSKTQKAIGAFRYYIDNKFSQNLNYETVATQFGCSSKTIKACMSVYKLGKEDILNNLFNGLPFIYDTVNTTTGEIVRKPTKSVEVALKVLKTTQTSLDPKDSKASSDEFSTEHIPAIELVADAIQKTENADIVKLLQEAFKALEQENNNET